MKNKSSPEVLSQAIPIVDLWRNHMSFECDLDRASLDTAACVVAMEVDIWLLVCPHPPINRQGVVDRSDWLNEMPKPATIANYLAVKGYSHKTIQQYFLIAYLNITRVHRQLTDRHRSHRRWC